MTTYYNFTAASAFSFPVMHRGRKVFVSFSAPVNGVSRYLTTDKALADKICAHRWFRLGLIRLRVETEGDAPASREPERPATVPERKEYSIMGRTMAPKIPTFRNPIDNSQLIIDNSGTDEAPAADADEEEAPAFSADDVTSFLEAKEYFITVMGVDRSLCTNKEALARLCEQYGVEFPNYNLM